LSNDLKAAFGALHIDDRTPLLTTDDIMRVGEQLESDTAAGILVIEHVWARNLKDAISSANGFLVDYGRIQPNKVEAAVNELAHMTH
jgi:hypothetical protein